VRRSATSPVYIHEAHPALWTIDDDQQTPNNLRLAYDYWGGPVITTKVVGSYADPTAEVKAKLQHGWNHSLGEIVTLLANNGLRIELLDEKRQVSWPIPFLTPLPDGEHYGWPPDQIGNLPLMYSLRARKS
jgi:hypothetical protein